RWFAPNYSGLPLPLGRGGQLKIELLRHGRGDGELLVNGGRRGSPPLRIRNETPHLGRAPVRLPLARAEPTSLQLGGDRSQRKPASVEREDQRQHVVIVDRRERA